MQKKRDALRLLPLALSLSLIGCATRSPPAAVQPAKIPPPPAELMQPAGPSGKYSESVEKLFLEWRERLMQQ